MIVIPLKQHDLGQHKCEVTMEAFPFAYMPPMPIYGDNEMHDITPSMRIYAVIHCYANDLGQ